MGVSKTAQYQWVSRAEIEAEEAIADGGGYDTVLVRTVDGSECETAGGGLEEAAQYQWASRAEIEAEEAEMDGLRGGSVAGSVIGGEECKGGGGGVKGGSRDQCEGDSRGVKENAAADYGSVMARVLEDVKGGSRDECEGGSRGVKVGSRDDRDGCEGASRDGSATVDSGGATSGGGILFDPGGGGAVAKNAGYKNEVKHGEIYDVAVDDHAIDVETIALR